MWGDGGRFYWGNNEGEESGIVVIFAWLSSEERHLKPYVKLYACLGWRTLVCHADFLTLFLPEKAASLADGVLKDLVQELKVRRTPVIFASFSGGTKGCMYKALQLIDAKCGGKLRMDEYQLIKDCLCGFIYDSTPVDFTSDIGTRFVLHPTVLKRSHPPRVVSWLARAIASGLDTLFISIFEAQRADYWQTLYSSVDVGPFLIFCSEDDDLAPCPVVCTFAQRLEELDGDVELIKWKNSPHVGHYKHHAVEYKAEVMELLRKAARTFSERCRHLHGERVCTEHPSNVSESVCNLHKAARSSNESLVRVANDPSDHFFLPSSVEYHETRDACSTHDERRGELFHMQNAPSLNPNGVLGKLLFDVCVPKNIEGWDIKPSVSSSGRQTSASARQHGPINPIKYLRRSKL